MKQTRQAVHAVKQSIFFDVYDGNTLCLFISSLRQHSSVPYCEDELKQLPAADPVNIFALVTYDTAL
jgi:hypothetical protein